MMSLARRAAGAGTTAHAPSRPRARTTARRPRATIVLVAVAAALASATSPRLARATEDDAKSFFAEGRRARLAGDCSAAVLAFRRALDLYPEGLGSLRNIAECEEQLGQFASARKDWWELRRAVLGSNEPKYAGWDKDAEEGYSRLEKKVAKLTIQVEGVSLERVKVSVDGKPLDPRLYAVALERDLGEHVVEASFGAVAPITVKRTLIEGANDTIKLEIPAPGAVVAQHPAPAKDRSAYKTAGWISLGVGVASLGAAGAFLGVRQSALSDVDSTCPGRANCSPSLKSTSDRGALAATLFDVFGAVGVVGVGVAVPLLVVGYRSGSAAPTTGAVTLVPAPGGARAEIAF